MKLLLETARMSCGLKPKPYQRPPVIYPIPTATQTPEELEDERSDGRDDSDSVIDLSTSDEEEAGESDGILRDLKAGALKTQERMIEVIFFTVVSN